MSVLLREIEQHIRQGAADTLRGADFRTDAELQSLTRQDLHELFPGPYKLKMRREIFELIHKQKPIRTVLKDLTGFIPHDELRSALTNNGVLVDYLHILKEIKTQVNNVQDFLDAHIDHLENMRKPQADMEPGKGASDSASKVESRKSQSAGHPQETQATTSLRSSKVPQVSFKQAPVVKYQKVICGQTFSADQQLLDQVSKSSSAQFVEDKLDSQVIIVFCPITSRVGSDVEAAMAKVKDDTQMTGNKPVILVLMHHTREAKYTSSVKAWLSDHDDVFPVSVFYHETNNGLLRCDQNNQAVSMIRTELQKHVSAEHDVSEGMDVERGGNDTASSGFLSSFFKRS